MVVLLSILILVLCLGVSASRACQGSGHAGVPLRRSCLYSILPLLLACDFVRPVAPRDRLPFVNGLLVAGDTVTIIELQMATSADSSWDGSAPRSRPESAELILAGNGTTYPAVFLPWGLRISAPIYADSTYRLSGKVDGIPIAAETHVPRDLNMITPTGDPIVIDTNVVCTSYCTLSFELTGNGAEGFVGSFYGLNFAFQFAVALTPPGNDVRVEKQTVGHMRRIDFTALDRNAARFLMQKEPRSSVEGGFGMLGSAIVQQRMVSVP